MLELITPPVPIHQLGVRGWDGEISLASMLLSPIDDPTKFQGLNLLKITLPP